MTAITITDLNNAKLDVDHIAAIATSTSPTATDRLGGVKKTIAGVNADLVSKVADVEAAKNTAVNTSIPSKVSDVQTASTHAITVDIPAAVALVNTEVAFTSAGEAHTSMLSAIAAKDLAQAAALASAVALAAKNTIAEGRASVTDGQTFWVKPNTTDSLVRFTSYVRTSSSAQTLIVSIGTGAEIDYLNSILTTRKIVDVSSTLAAWLDNYGRLAGSIDSSGNWSIAKLLANNAVINASTFVLPPALPGYVLGDKTVNLTQVTDVLSSELDKYGRISKVTQSDGSTQITKLRDSSGSLVYPQIAAIKTTADTALAMAAGSGVAPGSAKARLKAALAWGNWPRIMSSPPAVVIGTAGAASTISGSSLISMSDSRLLMLNATKTVAGTTYPDNALYKGISGHYGSTVFSNGVAVEFIHTGTELELYCKGTGGSFRIFVDDALTQEAAYGPMTNVGALFNIKVSFSGSASRRIRVEGIKSWGGVRIASGDSISAQARDYPLVVALGDSGWEGTGASLPNGGFSFTLGKALGWNMQSSGLGGTGIIAKGLVGVNTNYLDRITDLTVSGATLGIVPVSINDLGNTADAIRDSCYQIYAAWVAVNPNSPLIFMGPWVPRGTMPSSGIYALDEGIRKAAWALHCPYVDTLYPNPRTGTGSVISPVGDGNADIYTGFAPSDNLHPSQLGHEHFGLFYAARFKQIILNEV